MVRALFVMPICLHKNRWFYCDFCAHILSDNLGVWGNIVPMKLKTQVLKHAVAMNLTSSYIDRTWHSSKGRGSMSIKLRVKPIYIDVNRDMTTYVAWSKENVSRHPHQGSIRICVHPYETNSLRVSYVALYVFHMLPGACVWALLTCTPPRICLQLLLSICLPQHHGLNTKCSHLQKRTSKRKNKLKSQSP